MGLLADTKGVIEESGLEVRIVSAGGTGTLAFTPAHPVVTEVQAGGGVMMDALYSDAMQVEGLEHALTILTTVVSRPAPDRAIIDAGRKTMGDKHQEPVVVGREGVSIAWLSAEHGTLTVEGGPLEIGDKIEVIPGYSDMTVFLHERIHGIRNGRVEVVWDVLGRGKLQ
jgi:D-serine deaminase-like pyridoxal phosphate-dependent protein